MEQIENDAEEGWRLCSSSSCNGKFNALGNFNFSAPSSPYLASSFAHFERPGRWVWEINLEEIGEEEEKLVEVPPAPSLPVFHILSSRSTFTFS